MDNIIFIIEAALFASDEPLSLNRLQQLFADDPVVPDIKDLKNALACLQEHYQNRSLELVEIASGFCFRVKQDFSPWLAKLWQVKPIRYSRALLETLALIAYQQPITRAEIENIRGVSVSSHILKTLMDREWIKIVGHREIPGRPALFATTKVFLDHLNLKSLEELPSLEDIPDLEQVGNQLQIPWQNAEESLIVAEESVAIPALETETIANREIETIQ